MLIEKLNFKEFESATVSVKEPRKSPFHKPKKEEELPPPPPTFSEEELENAKREAYKQGFLEGTKEGILQTQNEQADVERVLMERLEKFAESIAPIFERYKAHCQQLKQNMPPLALAIAKKVAGNAISDDHNNIIETATNHCAETMLTEPNVTITINAQLADTLANKLKTLHGKVPKSAHIEVVPSEQILHGDYVIEWKNGSIEKTQEKIWQLIEKLIENMLSTIANEPEEQLSLLDNL